MKFLIEAGSEAAKTLTINRNKDVNHWRIYWVSAREFARLHPETVVADDTTLVPENCFLMRSDTDGLLENAPAKRA